MNIGNKIKEIRKSKGFTQEELANKCGLSKNGLWNYENNKRQINIDTLNKIANALDIDIEELINREKIIYSNSMKDIENLIEKYPDNATSISETIGYLADCLELIYVKKGSNSRDIATSNINLFNELISKISAFLQRDIVSSPSKNRDLYTKLSLQNIGEINNILNQILMNKLAMYSLNETINMKEGH